MTDRRATVRSIEDHFGQLGSGYDERAFATPGLQWVSERELTAIRRALKGLPNGSRALDAGCGNGRVSKLLSVELGHRVTALDPIAEMLETARNRVAGLTLVQARLGDRLPFRTASFDAVIAMRVLKWIPDWEYALSELGRVLRPGGRIAIEITNRNSLARFGYHDAPITLLTGAEVIEAGVAAGIWWHDTYAGTHIPHEVWKHAHRRSATTSAGLIQRLLDRILGARGARSFTLVGTRELSKPPR